MIPRYQIVVYWTLVAGILIMALLLIRGCERDHERIALLRDQSPIAAPSDIPDEQVSVAIANDADGSITIDPISLSLPEEPSLRARVLLVRLLADFARPSSTHALHPGPAVSDVFLLALPLSGGAATSAFLPSTSFGASSLGRAPRSGAQLAVVNLTKAFADAHPSGIEAEDLTLRSIIATLHANFPDIEQVRFLVDGQPRDTLAGHADLTRPYAVVDPVKAVHVLSADGSPI